MKKSIACGFFILLLTGSVLSAQDSISHGRALNFPTKKYGVSLGNSHEFNGLRINFADKNVKRINGVNITLWFKIFDNMDAVVNGVSIGTLLTAGSMQAINIGLLGAGADGNVNGLTIGGLVIGSGGNVSGLSVSGLLTMADGLSSNLSGVAISGLGIGAGNSINGIAFGGIGIGCDGKIRGLASSLVYLYSLKSFNGVGVTCGSLKAPVFNGVSIAGYSKTDSMNGLSLGLFNRTKELQGMQFGLLNYAGNNPKGLRILPLINVHFGK